MDFHSEAADAHVLKICVVFFSFFFFFFFFLEGGGGMDMRKYLWVFFLPGPPPLHQKVWICLCTHIMYVSIGRILSSFLM